MPSIDSALAFELGDSLFAAAIEAARDARGGAVLVGLCGSQASGKSTTAGRLAERLGRMGARTVVFSIDDFYLTLRERRELAAMVHPLLATRGVPGTHDVQLMTDTIDALLRARPDSITALPMFDKASDDRVPRDAWPNFEGRPDVVILEGWCVGARPQSESALLQPVNALEAREDADGRWRLYANACLGGDYAAFFAGLDLRLMLRAPSFECVHGWRAEQEAGLNRDARSARLAMTDAELARFIAHYERMTRWILEDEPADLIADIDERRAPFAWRIGKPHCDRPNSESSA
jgi:D-glycerate 3-kinase